MGAAQIFRVVLVGLNPVYFLSNLTIALCSFLRYASHYDSGTIQRCAWISASFDASDGAGPPIGRFCSDRRLPKPA